MTGREGGAVGGVGTGGGGIEDDTEVEDTAAETADAGIVSRRDGVGADGRADGGADGGADTGGGAVAATSDELKTSVETERQRAWNGQIQSSISGQVKSRERTR